MSCIGVLSPWAPWGANVLNGEVREIVARSFSCLHGGPRQSLELESLNPPHPDCDRTERPYKIVLRAQSEFTAGRLEYLAGAGGDNSGNVDNKAHRGIKRAGAH